jgi:putative endopeptidase
MNKGFLVVLAAAALTASCNQPAAKDAAKRDIINENRDTTVKPGDDFFAYANGAWMKQNPIPGDEATFGVGELVQRELYDKLKLINEAAVKKAEKSGAGQQIGDFWYAAMDSAGIEQAGIKPLQGELDKIAALKTPKEAMAQAAHMHTIGSNVFFNEGVGQDAKNSEVEAYGMDQGGLGMPNRDYYFKTDERTTKVRNAYPVFISRLFMNMGTDSAAAAKKATDIIAFETKLAAASRKLEDLRDPYKNYNKFAISQLNKLAPKTDWAGCLAIMGVKHVDSVIVGQPEF